MYGGYMSESREGGVDRMRHYIEQIFSDFTLKFIASLCGTLICAIEGFYTSLLWWFLLMFALDFVTGIMKSKKNGVPISSARVRDSVYKLGSYMVLITAVIAGAHLESNLKFLITYLYYWFIVTEAKSIIENAEAMGIEVPSILSMNVNTYLHKKACEKACEICESCKAKNDDGSPKS